jgi:hypothetical protein
MPTVNLVPLGLGELLDKTFSTFRKHFWLFAGIMVLPEAIMVGLAIVVQVYVSGVPVVRNPQNAHAAAQSVSSAMRVMLVSLGTMIPHYIVYALALGATTYALSEVYLGRATTIRETYQVVLAHFWQLIRVIFAIVLRCFGVLVLGGFLLGMVLASLALLPKSMAWMAVIVGLFAILGFITGAILMVIFLLRYSVAFPALVLENLSPRQALKRSVDLTRGFLWRLLVVAGLMYLITITLVSLCQSPFSVAAVLISVKGGRPSLWLTIPSLLCGGVGAVVTSPLLMISFAIAYYDLRVRKEGFDLQLMMSNLETTGPQGAASLGQKAARDRLDDASVPGMIFLTILTLGIYPPIWFLTRRRAFNNLQSREKLGWGAPTVALILMLVSACLPFAGSAKWGSWVQAEKALGPTHPLILLAAGIIMVVQCFKVRRILLDHLAPREEGMFSASIRFQYDDLLSRVGTFFLGIFYLQSQINGLINRLTAGQVNQGEMILPVSQELPAAPINL